MRALEDITPIDRYLELKALMEEHKEEMDALKPILMDALVMEDGEKYQRSGFEFTIQRRKTWEYDEEIKADIDQFNSEIKHFKTEIKNLEEHAKHTGKARVFKYTPVLVVKAKK